MIEFRDYNAKKVSLETLCGEDQSPDSLSNVFEHVQQLLIEDEWIQHIIVQSFWCLRPIPCVLVMTNIRMMIVYAGLFTLKFNGMRWRNFRSVYLSENFRGATIKVQSIDDSILELNCLPKRAARFAYSYAQSLEAPAEEYRRHRWMQEEVVRGSIGLPAEKIGLILGASTSSVPVQQPPRLLNAQVLSDVDKQEDPLLGLRKLKEYFDEGLISEQEYQEKKAQILKKF